MNRLYATWLRVWAMGHGLKVTFSPPTQGIRYMCTSRGFCREEGGKRERMSEIDFQRLLDEIAQNPAPWRIFVENEALEIPNPWEWEELCRVVCQQVRA